MWITSAYRPATNYHQSHDCMLIVTLWCRTPPGHFVHVLLLRVCKLTHKFTQNHRMSLLWGTTKGYTNSSGLAFVIDNHNSAHKKTLKYMYFWYTSSTWKHYSHKRITNMEELYTHSKRIVCTSCPWSTDFLAACGYSHVLSQTRPVSWQQLLMWIPHGSHPAKKGVVITHTTKTKINYSR